MTTYLGALSHGLRTITAGAYAAIMADAHPSRATWDELGEWRRRIHRIQARAVLVEALQPAPVDAGVFHVEGETGPLPGQEVLL